MAARMDLEARLRALRESKAARQPVYQPPTSPVAPADVAPPPPSKPKSRPSSKRGVASGPPRPNFSMFATPEERETPTHAAVQPVTGVSCVRAPPPPPTVDMVAVLGPAYEVAVQQAQRAIECERKRLVHTAIDAYIRAGQALVALGRQQTAPHLQAILRAKALALLQRAEGLEEWANRVIAANNAVAQASASYAAVTANHDDTLRDAVAQSQQQDAQALEEQEALVSKMKTQNDEMVQKLNQLVLLTKVRTRFRRIISARRARKAEEERLRGGSTASLEGSEQDQDLSETSSSTHYDDHDGDGYDDHDAAHVPTAARSLPSSLSSSPREEQKRSLLNELHARIGLPTVDHLRTFKPLSESADHDHRREQLETELEEAQLEAERLRVAVQEMEDTLRAAAEHSRERSLKLEKQKENEVAQLQAELQRMKSALDLERSSSAKRPSLYLDSDDDDDDERDTTRDSHAYEDSEIINKLRESLHGMSHDDTRGASGDKASRHRMSNRMGSWGFDRDEETHEDGDDDDGLWV